MSGAFCAEVLKLRGTMAAWMCLVAPALVVVMVVLQFGLTPLDGRPTPPELAWAPYLRAVLGLWAFLMLPLYITLQAALLGALEHGNHQWKHLFALAVPRWFHYMAKALVMVALVAGAHLALLVLAIAGGWILGEARPALGITGAPPWMHLLGRVGIVMASSGLMMALQLWVALRWSSFTVAVGTGMGATVAGFLIGQSKTYGLIYPWSLPMAALMGGGERMLLLGLAGILGALLLGVPGFWGLSRRDLK